MVSINGKPLDVDYHIKREYDGNKTLCFSISTNDDRATLIREEATVLCDGMEYVVKSVDEQNDTTNVECPLCMDTLKDKVYTSYTTTEQTLLQVLTDVITGTGWRPVNADMVGIRRSLELSDVSRLGIIEACRSTYGVVYDYDSLAKTITVIKPENILPKNVYITDQLNLQQVDYKGDTYEFCTRLYPYGKEDETTGEPLTIAGVNNGYEYIDNKGYCNKVLSRIWRDDRYTDAQQMKDDAIEKLKVLSQPVVSYQLTVVDLAKMNPKYKDMAFQLYDIVTLIDRKRKTKVNHRVVEYDEYPLHPENNKITLSTLPHKIEGILSTISGSLDQINVDNRISKAKVNEIKRDLDTTISRVGETYTKGETNTIVQSTVTQTKNDITMGFINGKISGSTQFSADGLDIYNGSLEIWEKDIGAAGNRRVFYYDKAGQRLCFAGIMKSADYTNLSVAIGMSETGTYGAFTVTDSGFGDMFSMYGSSDGVIWTAPFVNNIKNSAGVIQNRKGIGISTDHITLFADHNGYTCGIRVHSNTGEIEALGKINGSITAANTLTKVGQAIAIGIGIGNEIGISSSSPDVWFNYRPPNELPDCYFSGQSAQTYHFGNASKGGYGGIHTSDHRIHSTGYPSLTFSKTGKSGEQQAALYYNGDGSTNELIISVNRENANSRICLDAAEVSANGLVVTSDRAKKTNIVEVESHTLDKVRGLKFFSYDLDVSVRQPQGAPQTRMATITGYNERDADRQAAKIKHVDIGVMADEVPSEILGEDGKSIDLYKYVNLLAKSVQELAETVESQRLEIENLKRGVSQ